MKTVIRYIISISFALLASWIVYILTFEIVEYINPSKRYNANGNPEFVMPTFAIFCGLITSLTIFILTTIWVYKIFKKNRHIEKE
jgi:hypothetical protein